jgi:hypothetical protein
METCCSWSLSSNQASWPSGRVLPTPIGAMGALALEVGRGEEGSRRLGRKERIGESEEWGGRINRGSICN